MCQIRAGADLDYYLWQSESIIVSNPDHQVARSGDIFLLLVPSAQELHRLNTWQSGLQARYGGRVVPDPHITCQRFTPGWGKTANDCVRQLAIEMESMRTFQIYTDRLIQFYAPYWRTQVLRWRIQESDEYAEFRDRLDIALQHSGCPSHFNRRRHASCTAIELDQPIPMELQPAESGFPIPLFLAQTLWISELQADQKFSILETITFKPS